MFQYYQREQQAENVFPIKKKKSRKQGNLAKKKQKRCFDWIKARISVITCKREDKLFPAQKKLKTA